MKAAIVPIGMARAYSDDLRRRILQALERGDGIESELAIRFGVSYGYVKKIRRQQLRTGQMSRVSHHPGRKAKFTESVRERLRDWLRHQPDLTLAELQDKLFDQVGLGVSRPSLWLVLKKMGWRLKKKSLHTTPSGITCMCTSVVVGMHMQQIMRRTL